MFKNKKDEENSDDKNYLSSLKPDEYTVANVTQRAVIYDPENQKYLLAKGAIGTKGSFMDLYGPWEFFGGRVAKDEELIDGLKREIEEEAGDIKFEIVDSLGSLLIEVKSRKLVLIGYLVNYLEGEIKLDKEHSEYKWQTAKEILEDKEHKPWLKHLIEKSEKLIASQKNIDGWKRCQADFENYRKRQDESKKELKEFILEDLAMQILPVVDNFEMSLSHVPENQKDGAWVQGILHIQRQLETILKDNGISEIESREGDDFDPNFHEAIENHQEKEKEEHHKIKKIISKGFKIKDKVIRAVRVVVN